jgi:hypothetical protein
MNYAKLGMVETVTFGWIGQAHPYFGYIDENKEQISTLMKSEYPNMQYALFPQAFHYVTDKNVKMTTRGIALQITKHDDGRRECEPSRNTVFVACGTWCKPRKRSYA